MVSFVSKAILQVVRQGGDFYFEWPSKCHGWRIPELKTFLNRVNRAGRRVYKCRVDGCAYNLRNKAGTKHLLKRWTILTTDQRMVQHLGRRCPRNHTHAVIQSGETARSAFYPLEMAAKVAYVWATGR